MAVRSKAMAAESVRLRGGELAPRFFEAFAGLAPQQIHGGVVSDGEQPGIEAAARIVAADLAHYVEPGLLEQVIGRGRSLTSRLK